MSATKSMIRADLQRVSPQLAEKWLEKNAKNRKLDQDLVNQYFQQMKDGMWEVTTDVIGFSKTDRLINGQHRLHALVKYGKPLEFLVGHGFEEDAFNVIDTGKNRTAGDVLGVNEFTDQNYKAALVRWYLAYKKGKLRASKAGKRGGVKLTNQEILDFASEYREKLDEVCSAGKRITRAFKGLSNRNVGGLYWVFSNISREHALAFFEKYASGENLSEGDPVKTLRDNLIKDMGKRTKYPEMDKLAWAIMAWNKFRKGGKMTRFRYEPDKDDFPKPI